ncbi:hypothetical protein [Chitinophaga sp. CF418]|uniref:hypothetical protein n=1 Tax=Chitinophaga sp. CF418 TaxID=1855287 RepID=UPI00091F188A|nr:hypothetical protein [Chitinophaga sp. CF418]SHN45905.1 hypothetical protein SAMN05216311_12223 [Chitinophaga sp. CF418]
MSTFEKINSLVSRADTLVDDIHWVQGYPSKKLEAEEIHDQYLATTEEIKCIVGNIQREIDFVLLDGKVSLIGRCMHVILIFIAVVITAVVIGFIDVTLQPFSLKLIKPELAIQFVLNNTCSLIAAYISYFWGMKNGRLHILDIFNNDLD